MTLTEQWKKGELKSGWYYITTSFADEALREYFDGDEFRTVFTCNVKEVLAPVPSYEEWQRTFHYAGKYEHEYTSCVMDYENLKEENQQLKELLSKCLDELAEFNNSYYPETQELFSQITNAIGEK